MGPFLLVCMKTFTGPSFHPHVCCFCPVADSTHEIDVRSVHVDRLPNGSFLIGPKVIPDSGEAKATIKDSSKGPAEKALKGE